VEDIASNEDVRTRYKSLSSVEADGLLASLQETRNTNQYGDRTSARSKREDIKHTVNAVRTEVSDHGVIKET
jgi:hypothetical protein